MQTLSDIVRHYQTLTDIILISQNFKSTRLSSNLQELSAHAALAKISYFFNAFPRALCFAWKKAAVNYMRVEEKLWEQGWYFAISATVFSNVINSIVSSKCGLQNVIRFKEQLDKKKLLARAFSPYYMQGECKKVERLWVKDTQAMWNTFKLLVLHYDR